MAAAPSPSTQDPQVLPGLPPPLSSSRRLPPPCWSPEETVALIDAYREKWYSLRRGNLRASHWQEVADAVSGRCPLSSPAKTSVQCRHKMEKLRKRYRSELQRALATPNSHRFSSSWVHFKRMDYMEKGPSSAGPVDAIPINHAADNDDDKDEDDYQDLYENGVTHGVAYNRNNYGSMSNGIGDGSSGGSGFRIRIPGRSSLAPPGTKMYRNLDENPNPNFGSTRVLRENYSERLGLGKRGGGMGKKREGDPMAETVSAIKVLGDGFVRMERMKMEMAREVEAMRMEMELKRTEMILESQQRIVETFAKAFSEKKKKQREF